MQDCADFIARVAPSEADVVHRDWGTLVLSGDCDGCADCHSRVAGRRGDDKLNAPLTAVARELTVGGAVQRDSATEDQILHTIEQFVDVGPDSICQNALSDKRKV